jgi:hypothetical protein
MRGNGRRAEWYVVFASFCYVKYNMSCKVHYRFRLVVKTQVSHTRTRSGRVFEYGTAGWDGFHCRCVVHMLYTQSDCLTWRTPERRNVKVISQSTTSPHNPYLLTEQEEKKTLQKHAENKSRLRVPRRPAWTRQMTTAELERQEKAAFLDWRRGLAVYVWYFCP